MEQRNKLAEIKLVTKYYPVANYSYPRKEDGTITCTIRPVIDRTSIGSEASAPDLVDDNSDDEISPEDDRQYHAHTSDLWNSFWQPGTDEWKVEPRQICYQRHYPALIPSPRHVRQRSDASDTRQMNSWPLPDSLPTERNRKPAASYTTLPFNQQDSPCSQSRAPQRPSRAPPRPPRPDNLLLTPCLQQAASGKLEIVPFTNLDNRENAPRPRISGGHDVLHATRTAKSLDIRPIGLESSTPRFSDHHQRNSGQYSSKKAPRPCKSTSHLNIRQPEPVSVFEDDSSDDEEVISPTRSFFRFHKRSGSDLRHSEKTLDLSMTATIAATTTNKKRRHRAGTSPTSPVDTIGQYVPDQVHDISAKDRKRQAELFGRVLGRRSR